MRKLLLPLAAAAVLCLPAASQTCTPAAVAGQTMCVSGTHVTDASGLPLASGTIVWAPVDLSGRPLPFRKGGGGQAVSTPLTATVTNGAFSLAIADTSITSPINVCFSIQILDASTGDNVLGQGYTCVQPSSRLVDATGKATAAAGWCTATACNFDNYVPNTPGLPITQTGPVGPPGTGGVGNVTVSNNPDGPDYFLISDDATHAHWRLALQSDIHPDFGISGVGCTAFCGTFQPGQGNGGNPQISIAYVGGAPTAGSVSDASNAPVPLAAPWTSVTMPYTYQLNAPGQVCYTVSVTPTSTGQTCSSWQWLTFAGLSSGVPTGATADSASTLALTGTTGELSSQGFGVETGTFSFTPSGLQYIVFWRQSCSHTYQVNGYQANFTHTPLLLTNSYGQQESGCLDTSPGAYGATTIVGIN